MKARYLTIFSYIGTHFRSSEKLWLKNGSNYRDPESVQGLMEIALSKKFPLKYPTVYLSSRTDGGVHALNSSAHFDLETTGSYIIKPDKIAYYLNTYFYKTNSPILIKKCMRVSDNFHARFQALSRTYLYRLAVPKNNVELPQNCSIAQKIPIEELNRCHYMRVSNFDIERFKEGAKYFVGYHDFGSFRKFDKENTHKPNRRTIWYFDVQAGRSLQISHFSRTEELFDHWNIEIKGKSFVHNQIRRMVGTLIAVAVGKLPPEEVKVMLQIPSKHSWHHFIQNCPPQGLYLCNVEYNPEDLVYKADCISEKCEDSDIDSDNDSDQK